MDRAKSWTRKRPDTRRLIAMGLDDPEAATLAEWMTLRTDGELVTCYGCRHFGAQPPYLWQPQDRRHAARLGDRAGDKG